MGYNLYITRRKNLGDGSSDEISVTEWVEYVQKDDEMRMEEALGEYLAVWYGPSALETPWLQWSRGSIETKNPDPALIVKMVEIASRLRAEVRGEEEEVYDSSGNASAQPDAPSTGIFDRLRAVWSSISKPAEPSLQAVDLPFKVGDRVRECFGDQNESTVTMIDLSANHGLGRITVRYDDGRIGHFAAIAHGLEVERKG